jgi:hypothetical protein
VSAFHGIGFALLLLLNFFEVFMVRVMDVPNKGSIGNGLFVCFFKVLKSL